MKSLGENLEVLDGVREVFDKADEDEKYFSRIDGAVLSTDAPRETGDTGPVTPVLTPVMSTAPD